MQQTAKRVQPGCSWPLMPQCMVLHGDHHVFQDCLDLAAGLPLSAEIGSTISAASRKHWQKPDGTGCSHMQTVFSGCLRSRVRMQVGPQGQAHAPATLPPSPQSEPDSNVNERQRHEAQARPTVKYSHHVGLHAHTGHAIGKRHPTHAVSGAGTHVPMAGKALAFQIGVPPSKMGQKSQA